MVMILILRIMITNEYWFKLDTSMLLALFTMISIGYSLGARKHNHNTYYSIDIRINIKQTSSTICRQIEQQPFNLKPIIHKQIIMPLVCVHIRIFCFGKQQLQRKTMKHWEKQANIRICTLHKPMA